MSRHVSNLPPGVTDGDIEEAQGVCRHCGYDVHTGHSPACRVEATRRYADAADFRDAQDELDLNPATNPHADPWD